MKIMVLSTNIAKWGTVDALRKEARVMHELLCREYPEQEVILVSIEESLVEMHEGFTQCSWDKLDDLISQYKPDIIHIFEANPYLLAELIKQKQTLPCKTVFTCVDNDPLLGLNKHIIEEIVHLSEYDECFFFCYSDNAVRLLKQAGIRNVERTWPLLDLILFSKKNFAVPTASEAKQVFRFGFASSPFQQSAYKARGLELLSNSLNLCQSEIKVTIPWRDSLTLPPDFIINNPKIELSYGFIDMKKYFDSIDAYILPFVEEGNNHASPHSFWEALFWEKPFVVTDKTGISTLVKEYGIGEVVVPEKQELAKGLDMVCQNYGHYKDQLRFSKEKLMKSILAQTTIVEDYYRIYESLLPHVKSTMITLDAWKNRLIANDSYLVKGTTALKDYYSVKSEAEAYREKRFSNFPMNIVNLMELQTIDLILSKYKNQITLTSLQLMDIAAGEGRIAEVLFPYGNVWLVENSASMLRVCLELLSNKEMKTQIIKSDFLESDLNRFSEYFDVITSFRFLRHFEYPFRQQIYDKVKSLLKPDGIFLFDVPNKITEVKLRNKLGWENFNIYDVFWTQDSITRELRQSGFDLQHLIGIGKYCFKEFLGLDFNLPMSWIAIAKSL